MKPIVNSGTSGTGYWNFSPALATDVPSPCPHHLCLLPHRPSPHSLQYEFPFETGSVTASLARESSSNSWDGLAMMHGWSQSELVPASIRPEQASQWHSSKLFDVDCENALKPLQNLQQYYNHFWRKTAEYHVTCQVTLYLHNRIWSSLLRLLCEWVCEVICCLCVPKYGLISTSIEDMAAASFLSVICKIMWFVVSLWYFESFERIYVIPVSRHSNISWSGKCWEFEVSEVCRDHIKQMTCVEYKRTKLPRWPLSYKRAIPDQQRMTWAHFHWPCHRSKASSKVQLSWWRSVQWEEQEPQPGVPYIDSDNYQIATSLRLHSSYTNFCLWRSCSPLLLFIFSRVLRVIAKILCTLVSVGIITTQI